MMSTWLKSSLQTHDQERFFKKYSLLSATGNVYQSSLKKCVRCQINRINNNISI